MISLAAAGLLLLTSRSAGPDLFDLVPRVPRLEGYVLVAWPRLERAQFALDTGAISSGTMICALGYMADGDKPLHDGASVENFVLLPDAGTPLHPAHRHGDQMITVRLATGNTVRFAQGSLVWAWGRWRVLRGDPEGREPLYLLESALAEPAGKADIARHFR